MVEDTDGADLIKKCKHEDTMHTQSGVTNLSSRTEQT